MKTALPFVTAVAASTALTACAQQPPGSSQPPPAASATRDCEANPAQFAVGQPGDDALYEQVRARSGANRVRVVRPGEMVTMDFDPKRVTIELDATGRVSTVKCG